MLIDKSSNVLSLTLNPLESMHPPHPHRTLILSISTPRPSPRPVSSSELPPQKKAKVDPAVAATSSAHPGGGQRWPLTKACATKILNLLRLLYVGAWVGASVGMGRVGGIVTAREGHDDDGGDDGYNEGAHNEGKCDEEGYKEHLERSRPC